MVSLPAPENWTFCTLPSIRHRRDGAVIMICKEGECRYMEGNMRARKRAHAVDELLQEAGLGKGRTRVIQMDDEGIAGVIHKLEDFRLQIKTMVQNTAVNGVDNSSSV